MTTRTLIPFAVILMLVAACSRQEASPQLATTPAPPTPQQLSDIKVSNLKIDRATIRRDQGVTVTVQLNDVPAGTDLTLAWFGPDGWLAHDDTQPADGTSVSFMVPAGTFRSPGRYRAGLRAGTVHLADVNVEVTG